MANAMHERSERVNLLTVLVIISEIRLLIYQGGVNLGLC